MILNSVSTAFLCCVKSELEKFKFSHVLVCRHSDRRDFKCPSCGNAFKRKDKLKDHQKRMHSKPTDAVLRDEQNTEKVEVSYKFAI
jgi:hypothetical protein